MENIIIPVADVYETAEEFVLKLDLPGVEKEKINITIQPGRISIKGEVDTTHRDEARLLLREIGLKTYYREFNLGEGIQHQAARAEFEQSVLTVILPKTDAAKAKIISIR
ncbi:MAG: Hsp20/alpha crystallin family protein [Ignavibacteriales bacterium]|nr:Hsp20/alpha crystallin family protein [Ignavibacteriales bacterium]